MKNSVLLGCGLPSLVELPSSPVYHHMLLFSHARRIHKDKGEVYTLLERNPKNTYQHGIVMR